MLTLERQSIPYVKSEFNASLRAGPLQGRTKASIEYRMQNISAVLESLGYERIRGYLPAKNVGENVRASISQALIRHGMPVDQEPTVDLEAVRRKAQRIKQWGLQSKPNGVKEPRQVSVQCLEYVRDPRVQAWVLAFADGHCELCGTPAPFVDRHGEPFLEVHHVTSLSEGGSDTVENTVALCPNCHRKCHYSARPSAIKQKLYAKVARLRPCS
ncbi:MAG: HNH endonuclease [Candidatus Hydrogenedentes bacterium]|nr:HNH endonuclease [Candidatus Hydrogenedentota bacterium]